MKRLQSLALLDIERQESRCWSQLEARGQPLAQMSSLPLFRAPSDASVVHELPFAFLFFSQAFGAFNTSSNAAHLLLLPPRGTRRSPTATLRREGPVEFYLRRQKTAKAILPLPLCLPGPLR